MDISPGGTPSPRWGLPASGHAQHTEQEKDVLCSLWCPPPRTGARQLAARESGQVPLLTLQDLRKTA